MVFFNTISSSTNDSEDVDIKNYLMQINTGLSHVLSNAFNCERFSNELLCNFHDDHSQICLEIMKQLLHSNDTSNIWYLNHDDNQRNIFHHLLFVCIPKGDHLLKAAYFFTLDFNSIHENFSL